MTSDATRDGWQDIATTPDDPNGLRGKRVLVMGLGLLGGGVAAARYAVSQGAAEVKVTDLRSEEMLAASVASLAGLPIRYALGGHDPEDFRLADVIVRNPNVKRDSPYLAIAREAGKRIEMEIAWFFRACPGKIAGVTGTRGKSTTTLLLHHILTVAGWNPLLGGNLGGIETVSLLPQITPDRWTVLELGNWMLEGLHTVRRSPQLAIFTNLMPDHLDSYDSMEDYGQAKTSIFRYQRVGDVALFNADNDYTRRYAVEAPGGDVWLYSAERGVSYPRERPAETRPFRYVDAIRLRGAHNLGNVQAATLAAELLGVSEDAIRTGVESFGGVPHRLEVVRTLDGVTWVNDSASTAPVAGVAALNSFTEPLVLIAGGNTKRLDHSAYAEQAATRAKRIVLLKGSATEAFAADLRAAAARHGLIDPVEGIFDDFAAAIQRARELATPGDIVLLSPGFTSFGMFLHEFDRGEQFRRLVQALPE
ncbi:MAG TPA: UDP-N-acetylmuramoyl-L-alanine--D-glutamate ligase [Ktedonobacterales bacterium]